MQSSKAATGDDLLEEGALVQVSATRDHTTIGGEEKTVW